jgi:undecaprenyl pyrophosphate synthase
MKGIPRLIVQSMVKIIQFSTERKPRKHLEVSSCMELLMEYMINQINQLNLHLLQPRISKSKNVERDLSTI